MKKTVLISLLLTAFCAATICASENGVAVVKKTVNDVRKKPNTGTEVKAKSGTPLFAEEQLSTGKKSFALVKFTEDNSMIRVREQSVLTVKAEGPRNSSAKEVYMNKGGIGFEVSKQKLGQQFKLTSPTSVASIRGTKGTWSLGEFSDTLIVLEGLIILKNRNSNNEVEVGAGYIGISFADGRVTVREATQEELSDALKLVTLEEKRNELKIELKDSKGTKRTLKMQYKE